MAGKARDPEIQKALDLFPKGQHKAVLRLLQRALDKRLKVQDRALKRSTRTPRAAKP